MELELYSTNDLIEEIMGRHTFQGIIIQASSDCKNNKWNGVRDFDLHWNENLTKKEASMILEQMATVLL